MHQKYFLIFHLLVLQFIQVRKKLDKRDPEQLISIPLNNLINNPNLGNVLENTIPKLPALPNKGTVNKQYPMPLNPEAFDSDPEDEELNDLQDVIITTNPPKNMPGEVINPEEIPEQDLFIQNDYTNTRVLYHSCSTFPVGTPHGAPNSFPYVAIRVNPTDIRCGNLTRTGQELPLKASLSIVQFSTTPQTLSAQTISVAGYCYFKAATDPMPWIRLRQTFNSTNITGFISANGLPPATTLEFQLSPSLNKLTVAKGYCRFEFVASITFSGQYPPISGGISPSMSWAIETKGNWVHPKMKFQYEHLGNREMGRIPPDILPTFKRNVMEAQNTIPYKSNDPKVWIKFSSWLSPSTRCPVLILYSGIIYIFNMTGGNNPARTLRGFIGDQSIRTLSAFRYQDMPGDLPATNQRYAFPNANERNLYSFLYGYIVPKHIVK